MVGIKEVAFRAGVSISTVSNVLNNRRPVSEELRQKVLKVAKELAYEPDPIARNMKAPNSKIIGVIVGDMYGVFYPFVIKGIDEIASPMGYTIITSGGKDSFVNADYELELFNQFVNNRVDGIIFVSAISNEKSGEHCERLLKIANKFKRTPIVSIERNFAAHGIDSVYFNGYENSRLAMKHLLDCGCRKICHISGPSDIIGIVGERIKGYRDAMKEAGLEVGDDMIVSGNYSHQGGYLAMKELMRRFPDLDGVFCGNDQMAVGAVKAVKELGKVIPDDIRIIGYDDVFVSSIVDPPLSSIHIKKRHAGIEAARLLIDRIENEAVAEKPQEILMEGRLVVRQSTVASAQEDWILTDW